MGSVTQLKYPLNHSKAGQQRKQSKRLGWQLRYMDPKKKKSRISTTFWGSRKDAEEEMSRLEQGTADGLSMNPDIRQMDMGSLRARALADYFWLTRPSGKDEGVRRATSSYSRFKSMMTIVGRSGIDSALVRTITSSDMDRIINNYRLQNGAKPSEETLKTLTGALTKLFSYAVNWGVISVASNPMTRRTQTSAKFSYGKPVKWAPNETEMANVAAFLEKTDLFLAHILRVFYWTGMRVEEGCGLKVSQIDWDNRRIVIEDAVTVSGGQRVEGSTKTPAGARQIPIVGQCEESIRFLQNRAHGKSDYLFMGTRPSRLAEEMERQRKKRVRHAISYSTWRKHLRMASLEASQQSGQKYFTTLDCRHAYATNLLNVGYSVGETATLLGHSTEKIVRTRYQSVVDRDLTLTAEDLTNRFNGL